MSIQRLYSLPNCTLTLDGWGEEVGLGNGDSAGRPLLSILTSFECRFNGHDRSIKGGREFFEQLIATASAYAQQFLSGVPYSRERGDRAKPVVIEQVSSNFHRLTIYPQALTDDPARTQSESISFDLMTVQLFDLVEAIDQFYADSQTIPGLTLSLTPVRKRQTTPKQPLAKRALPAALGVAGLATAAIAFFFVPVPEFRPTEEAPSEAATDVQTNSTDTAANGDNPPAESESSSETAESLNPTSDLDEATDEATEVLFSDAPLIVEPDVVDQLMVQLQENLFDSWTQEHSFEDALVYRVAVAENGDVLGFKYVNDAALVRVDETPLPDLQYTLLDPEAAQQEPVAQYRVVFTPAGAVEVSPWHGRLPEASTEQEPVELGTEITDPAQLANLNWDLYDLILDGLEDADRRSLSTDISYRVNMTPDGVVVDYEPLDDAASDFLSKTPLPTLAEAATESDRQDDQGQFLVVITQDGVLQVSPWQGF
ncbi:MAG: DUF4335 domain-containing protein [Synechococcales cyanobacterium K44_A2020_017]|nr:DUF4335 domain-containing protein [Synechococcales cyanobacterium K32_A2020_035]MBF2094798.1 DUF4335 domain-containing protein [Synechococcales cyanobacterium K44_A2020_017]